MDRQPASSDMLRLAIVGLAAGLLLAGCGDPSGAPLRGDDELIALFERERASFDSLATMLDEDRNLEMLDRYAESVQVEGAGYAAHHDPGATLPGVAAERWNTYERLLRRINAGRNVWNGADGILVQQYVAKYGPGDARWMRGYWYARVPVPAGGVTTGDLLADSTYAGLPRGGAARYRPLEGSWYLYSHKGYSD